MKDKLNLEQSLQAYRVMNTPTKFSWKQHWAQETFSNPNAMLCPESEWKQFSKRLKECHVTICNRIEFMQGTVCTFEDLINLLTSSSNKKIAKKDRKVIYSTSNGERPVGKKAYELWNGFQVIDLDIKNEEMSLKLKEFIFNKLYKCNWFLGVALSSSGRGLHVYTKISIPESEEIDDKKKKVLYLTNFRHKYSFVYLILVSGMEIFGYDKDQILAWMDLMMFKPQQGAFIGYDKSPLINSQFFSDFIYINFDNVEDIGHPDIDWVSHPDLKSIFKRWEWFEDGDGDLSIEAVDKPRPEFLTHNKIHYKHFERWRLANTLVTLYGESEGYNYLREICSNNIKDKELLADCQTAKRHEKPIDPWAVNRLNQLHGFKIKLNIPTEEFDESNIFKSMEQIDNPTMIQKSKYVHNFHLSKDQYLGNIKNNILDNIGRVTLLDAGPGLGKTEMVKQIVREGKKIIMVMPFTSTIKSKIEKEEGWYYAYASRKPRLDVDRGLCVTIDKFTRLNLMDIKTADFDYIFIDESHLMFMSEYRDIMPKAIEMVRNSETPVILMSGTPTGELVFFPDIVHIKVTKEETRKKELKINLVDSTGDLMYHMCRKMANDICLGRRILFPTNSGTLFSKQVEAGITYFLENEHMVFEPLRSHYYKKSNVGEVFMDDVNFESTIKDTQILFCSEYLSVGTDILDKFDFSVYFSDLMCPQNIEQFANRIRKADLYINMFVAKNDVDGNSRELHKYKEINFKLNDEEIKNVHSILKICNGMIERNPTEYRYNSLITSIIQSNKYVEYNEVDNRYYLNEIAYKTVYFERKYKEYVEQLPVMMKGMQSYGYQVSIEDLKEFQITGTLIFRDLKDLIKLAYDKQLQLNSQNTIELMEMIQDGNLDTYKEVMGGKYDIRRGDDWGDDKKNKCLIVKDIEVFEKVVPVFTSLSKRYTCDTIRDIFYHCQNKNGSFNFAAINRIRLLVNILYNDKNGRLDLPIQEYMKSVYEFSDLKTVHKNEIVKFNMDWARKYADMESTNKIIINRALLTMELLQNTFKNLFKCFVNVSRPSKDGIVNMERVELIWKEKELGTREINDRLFILADFLGNNTIDVEEVTEINEAE